MLTPEGRKLIESRERLNRLVGNYEQAEDVRTLLAEIDRRTPTPPVLNAEGLAICPIPWCSRTESPQVLDEEEVSRCVYCPTCGFSGPEGKTRAEAVQRWNTRTTVAAPAVSEAEEPYRVEVESDGCGHCGEGKQWAVVYAPSDEMSSRTYSCEDDAEHEADVCNLAFNRGRAARKAQEQGK